MNLENKHNNKLERLGFSFERGGVHTARTMMLAELRALLSFVDAADAAKAEYLDAIQTANCLGKRSGRTRALTFRHLADLYALDPSSLVFRALRFFWQRDVDGQPLLAALCAYSRDPILRATAPFVLGIQGGATVTREGVEAFIDAQEPGRFQQGHAQVHCAEHQFVLDPVGSPLWPRPQGARPCRAQGQCDRGVAAAHVAAAGGGGLKSGS